MKVLSVYSHHPFRFGVEFELTPEETADIEGTAALAETIVREAAAEAVHQWFAAIEDELVSGIVQCEPPRTMPPELRDWLVGR